MRTALKTRSWLQMMMQRSIATDDSISALAGKLTDVQDAVAGLTVRHVEQHHHLKCESCVPSAVYLVASHRRTLTARLQTAPTCDNVAVPSLDRACCKQSAQSTFFVWMAAGCHSCPDMAVLGLSKCAPPVPCAETSSGTGFPDRISLPAARGRQCPVDARQLGPGGGVVRG